MRVAVAGGTGQVGRRVVKALRERGDDAVVLSRSQGVDLVANTGVGAAMERVEAVIDCSSTPGHSKQACVDFFGAVGRNLQAAGAAAGVRRIVTLSIVGIDRDPDMGHHAGKLAQEAASREGKVPATIMRATQFHTFGDSVIEWFGKGPLLPCWKQPAQTVDLDSVVAHLIRLGDGAEESKTINLAGPQRCELPDIVRRTAKQRGRRGIVVPLRLPGASARARRQGALLPQAGDDALIEGRSFDDWMAAGAPPG